MTNQPSSIIYHLSSKRGFSLLEILITVTLLILLSVALLITLNPWAQINKGWDSKRKTELTQLNKVFEDYYNDKQCYPTLSKVCYNASSGTTCNICGNQSTSPTFSPYLSQLPCDPQQPTKKYTYQTDGSSCPGWYIVYTLLSNTTDPVISEVDCQNGCGPTGNVNFNYFVSSSNIILEGGIGPTTSPQNPTSTPTLNPTLTPGPLTPTSPPGATPIPTTVPTATPALTPTPTVYYVGNCSTFSTLFVNPNCNVCGNYTQCKITHPGGTYYTDASTCLAPCFPD